MGSIIVSRGKASEENIEYTNAIVIPVCEFDANARAGSAIMAEMLHIKTAVLKPNLSYTIPVVNFETASVRE